MGYPIDLFLQKDLDPEFICSICKGVLQDPVLLKDCQHQFCKLCIDKSNTCPTDGSQITRIKPVFGPFLRLLNRLSLQCQFSSRGCRFIATVGNCDRHTEHCEANLDYEKECVKKCGAMVAMRDLASHNCTDFKLQQLKEFTEKKFLQLENELQNSQLAQQNLQKVIQESAVEIGDLAQVVGNIREDILQLKNQLDVEQQEKCKIADTLNATLNEIAQVKDQITKLQCQCEIGEQKIGELQMNQIGTSSHVQEIQRHVTDLGIKGESCKAEIGLVEQKRKELQCHLADECKKTNAAVVNLQNEIQQIRSDKMDRLKSMRLAVDKVQGQLGDLHVKVADIGHVVEPMNREMQEVIVSVFRNVLAWCIDAKDVPRKLPAGFELTDFTILQGPYQGQVERNVQDGGCTRNEMNVAGLKTWETNVNQILHLLHLKYGGHFRCRLDLVECKNEDKTFVADEILPKLKFGYCNYRITVWRALGKV